MKKQQLILALGMMWAGTALAQSVSPGVPASNMDSVYLFSYATAKNKNHNGLHFAWSQDKATWHEIGPEHAFVKSDYGNWGPQKRMLNPSLRQTSDGGWEAVWEVNEQEKMVAYCTTPDLVHWKPQDYYPKTISDYFTNQKTVLTLPNCGSVRGEVHRVAWPLVQGLIDECARAQAQARLDAERVVDDASRYPNLKPQHTTITITTEGAKTITDKLIGIFFEDINYGADGGLYAELVQNRDFEYHPRDFRYRDPKWNAKMAWTLEGAVGSFEIDSLQPIHPNNPHYAVVQVADGNGAFSNTGYDGIVVRKGEKYDFSMFGRLVEGTKGKVLVQLRDVNGVVIGKGTVNIGKGGKWTKRTLVLKAEADCDNARLTLVPQQAGTYHFDMVSLFPQQTFKGRKNGLRADLAQALADLKPRFVRFPGGCVAHGDGLDNLYRWKNTIGSLESRVPNWNIWKYHQTAGLGYYEFFQMCEDFGAEPLPVVAAAVPCQNSCVGGYGQQGGVPMEEMDAYIQDILDLIEWANGDPKTSQWARLRAEAGHPEPFNLKYLGIGNEDLISDVFKKRFEMIYNAVHAKYPEITLIGTTGPSSEGSDYEEGWRFARQLEVPMVDEHYYRSPGWFIHHQDYYDRYQRGGTQVYLGEYAAHIPKRTNCIETALAEAMHLCNVERNGDVVAMTSYAPLLAKRGHTQWNPDMIYFSNTEVTLTAGYQVQRLFGNNAGTRYLPSLTVLARPNADVQRRIVSSCVVDEATGDIIVKVVNMLPVENTLTIRLPEGTQSSLVESTVLTGKLGEVRAVPVALDGVTLTDATISSTVPAYSFVVYRVKAQ